MSPDPYMASGGPSDPGSWNRYVYVGGEPINFRDPSGEKRICTGPEDDQYCWDEPDFPLPNSPGPDPQVSTGGTQDPGDRSNLTDEEWIARRTAQRLETAIGGVMEALINPKCSSLFGLAGAPSAKTLFSSLVSGKSNYGYIQLNHLGTSPTIVTSATTRPDEFSPVPIDGGEKLMPSSVVITINLDAGTFQDGSAEDRIVTLLHELGHAFHHLFGVESTQIAPDSQQNEDGTPNPDYVQTSIANSNRIRKACGF